MPEFTAVDPDSLQDITCTICLEPWDTPLEVGGCGHIFCTKCLGTLTKCPECRGDVTRKQAPNRVLCNMANEAKLRCIVCPWQGTREESRRHTTCLAATAAASPPAVVKPQPVAQQPSPPVRTALDTNLSAPAWAATPAPACAPPQRPIQQPPPQQPQRPPQPPANNWHACPWLEFGMTQEEYDHIMCVFMTFDTDGSGELSRRELTTLCRYLNYAQRPEQIDAMFAEMDSDRSGQLSMREFCTWVSMHRPDPSALYGLTQMEYETVQFAFHSADTNQDGFLSESEFVTMLMSQRLTSSAGEAGQVFRTVDMDRDGRVTLDEFLRYRASTSRFGAAPPAPPPQFVPPPAPYVNPAQPYPQAAPIQRPPAQVGRGSVRGTIVEVSGPFNFRFTVVVSIGSNSFGTGLLEAGPCMPVQQNFAVQIPPNATEMVFRVLRNGDGLEVGGTAVNLQHIPLQNASQQYDRWMDLSIVQPAAVNHQPVKLHVKMNVFPN